MTARFSEKMPTLSDEEIVRIARLGESEGYEIDAVQAAQVEFERRNISATDVEEIAEIAKLDQRFEESKIDLRLSNGGRVAFVLLSPFLIPCILAIFIYYYRGYSKKGFDATKSMLIGFFGLYGLIAILFAIADCL